jgi:ribosomal protein S18 acetylase RimI-like enzyme
MNLFDLESHLANSREYWLGWADTDRVDGSLVLYRSGVPDRQLNGVLRLHGRDVDDALAEARSRLGGVPWMWWVGMDSDPGVAEALAARGLTEIGLMAILAIDLDQVAAAPLPDGVTVAEVDDDLREWVVTYTPSMGLAPEQVDEVLAREAARSGLVRFEARLDGRVIGTSVLCCHAGVAGVYLLTVAPSCRGRGIGTALAAAALRAGRERGLRIGMAQAATAGRSLYERMGFETVSGYRLFTA